MVPWLVLLFLSCCANSNADPAAQNLRSGAANSVYESVRSGGLLLLEPFESWGSATSLSGVELDAHGVRRASAGFDGPGGLFDGDAYIEASVDINPHKLEQVTFGAWVKIRDLGVRNTAGTEAFNTFRWAAPLLRARAPIVCLRDGVVS